MKIYIVQGNTGEWDSYQDWTVCACSTESGAKARIDKLVHLMMEINPKFGDKDAIEKMRTHKDGDPQFDTDTTGASYDYYETELIEE